MPRENHHSKSGQLLIKVYAMSNICKGKTTNIEMNRIRIMASLVILALLATASFSSAQAQQPSEEQLAKMLKRFPEADTDKGGKLSTEEIEAVRQKFRRFRQRKTRPAAAATCLLR